MNTAMNGVLIYCKIDRNELSGPKIPENIKYERRLTRVTSGSH